MLVDLRILHHLLLPFLRRRNGDCLRPMGAASSYPDTGPISTDTMIPDLVLDPLLFDRLTLFPCHEAVIFLQILLVYLIFDVGMLRLFNKPWLECAARVSGQCGTHPQRVMRLLALTRKV